MELVRPGFPFLREGRHVIEGDLPWLFWDMCPSGSLGRRLANQQVALRVAGNPRDWSAADVLTVLTHAGADLAGNLLLGEASLEAFRTFTFEARGVGGLLEEVLREAASFGPASSLGGERPKLLGTRADGSASLVKFSPPLTSPQGQRWSDLLRLEAHCAAVLRQVLPPLGGAASLSTPGSTRGRTTLTVERFDRLRGRGRVGVGTLSWLAMERWGDVALSAPEVVRRLHLEGLIALDQVTVCERVHAFSAAIGNNDAHLGNYALLFDDTGTARLAPLYDVLPMAFAPRNDELPDEYLSPAFQERWLRSVGALR
ncbi:MAG: HipA domain-containing protein [Myxococcaceae bacterium]|nr:HipA domain-containing protein [Myxococcaceae bacterium]MCA3015711.1 HipA domain-containing protein [Myxococcaceae bacterium]